jgi:proteasome lid subunit RPN8/RPN11
MSVLVLPPPLRGELETDALARAPEEACGLLVGRAGSDRSGRALVRAVRSEENVDSGDRTRRFTISPERLLAIQKELRGGDLEVIGYYHSHVDSPAVPSPLDLLAAWPATSYLILSVAAGSIAEIRSWRLDEDTRAFEEEDIEYESA